MLNPKHDYFWFENYLINLHLNVVEYNDSKLIELYKNIIDKINQQIVYPKLKNLKVLFGFFCKNLLKGKFHIFKKIYVFDFDIFQ